MCTERFIPFNMERYFSKFFLITFCVVQFLKIVGFSICGEKFESEQKAVYKYLLRYSITYCYFRVRELLKRLVAWQSKVIFISVTSFFLVCIFVMKR